MNTSILLHLSLGALALITFLLAPVALVVFAGTEELSWLRISYWLGGAGVIAGIAAVLCSMVAWVSTSGPAERATSFWYTGACLLVICVESSAWVGLGGWNGVPSTTNRDITVAMMAQFIGVTLALATACMGWTIASQPAPTIAAPPARDERFREAAPRRRAA